MQYTDVKLTVENLPWFKRGEPFENIGQVAKLKFEDFDKMFALHNLQIEEVYGDYK